MTDSFLASYSNDIFISYTHLDNAPFGPDNLEWISHLHEHLKTRLQQYVGGSVGLWRDTKLTGNDVFGEELVDRVASCALIISICSPRYVTSEWCNREIETFVATHGSRIGGSKSRVFKVLKTPVDRDALPSELDDVLGYEFYRADDASSRFREFLLEPPTERWRFYTVLDDLAQDIRDALIELRDNENTASEPAPVAVADAGQLASTPDAHGEPAHPILTGKTVYLAQPGSDLALHREEIRRDLERRGHLVLPDEPLELTRAELLAHVDRDLARSDASVHLLGEQYGVIPEGETRSYGHLELERANQYANANELRQYVWRLPDITIDDDRQAELIARLEAGHGLGDQTGLFSCGLEELKTVVNDDLARASDLIDLTEPPSSDAIVYLLFDHGDAAGAGPVQAHLEAAGCFVITPHLGDDPAASRVTHQENLKMCEGVLIYQATATDQWLTMAIRDLIKAPAWGRTDPFAATAVLLGPPATAKKAAYSSGQVQVLQGTSGELDQLDSFLISLGSAVMA